MCVGLTVAGNESLLTAYDLLRAFKVVVPQNIILATAKLFFSCLLRQKKIIPILCISHVHLKLEYEIETKRGDTNQWKPRPEYIDH